MICPEGIKFMSFFLISERSNALRPRMPNVLQIPAGHSRASIGTLLYICMNNKHLLFPANKHSDIVEELSVLWTSDPRATTNANAVFAAWRIKTYWKHKCCLNGMESKAYFLTPLQRSKSSESTS